jgi:predicted dehydrogenase
MGKIRVALIGLSSTAKVSWAAEGHLPYLLSPLGKSHYEIVALLNSSVKAAEAAKVYFNLPASVEAFGDPIALAAQPNIDLVVCITRVDLHSLTAGPSLKAGKAVYIEWPLAENLDRAAALIGSRQWDNSIAGLQGRVSPIALKLKEILASGRIGRVLSSDIRSFGSLLPRDVLPQDLTYFAERHVGGNPITIAYAHMIDYVHEVLGEFASFESRMQIQRPTIKVVGKDGTQTGSILSDVPDFLAVHGRLTNGKQEIADNATLAVTYRSGPPFKGTPAFVWTINGEKGELLVTSPSGPYLHSDSYEEPVRIELHDHASDEVLDVPWDWKDWQKELPVRTRIVAELYERYALWVGNGKDTSGITQESQWPRLHDAAVRLKEFDTLFAQYDAQSRG